VLFDASTTVQPAVAAGQVPVAVTCEPDGTVVVVDCGAETVTVVLTVVVVLVTRRVVLPVLACRAGVGGAVRIFVLVENTPEATTAAASAPRSKMLATIAARVLLEREPFGPEAGGVGRRAVFSRAAVRGGITAGSSSTARGSVLASAGSCVQGVGAALIAASAGSIGAAAPVATVRSARVTTRPSAAATAARPRSPADG
jgi:hypothetical protein